MPEKPTKPCKRCGRAITWRRKWARDWDNVKYCGESCRRHKPGSLDQQLEIAILALLEERANDKTICPSEAARRVSPEDWHSLMEPARHAARRLVVAGKVVITQQGKEVDPSTAKGPIRIRRV